MNKQQLEVVNQTNFPNNNTGYISAELLREFNTDVIDSFTLQSQFDANSASVASRLSAQEAFSSSIAIDYINQSELNSATASLSAALAPNINNKALSSSFNSFTSSTNGRLDFLEVKSAFISQSNQFNQDNYFQQQVYILEDLNLVGKASITGSVTASGIKIVGNSTFGGNAFDTSSFNGFVKFNNPDKVYFGTQSWSDFSSSVYTLIDSSSAFIAFSSSVQGQINGLKDWSSSLDLIYATDAQLNASSSTLQFNINQKLDTSSFIAFSSSYNSDSTSFDNRLDLVEATASYLNTTFSQSVDSRLDNEEFLSTTFATTGSNTFVGNQLVNGTLQISSSATYDVDITGGFQATAASRISSSAGINSLTPTFNQISASTGLSIMSRGYVAGQMGSNQIALFSSGSTNIGGFQTAPIGIAGIAINSGSTTNAWYYPIQFQPSTNYTDGRVSVTTLLSASAGISSSNLSLSNGLNVTGSIDILSGSASGSVITNVGDIYSSSAAVTKIISLSQSEYTALGSKDPNTFYIIV